MTALRRDPSKVLLFGFLTLLVVLIVQVVWWVKDQIRYANEVEQNVSALYSADAVVVGELRRGGMPALDTLMPHLEVRGGDVRVKPEALADVEQERRGHNNRYLWEGAFFLAVLIGGMAVLSRAILHDRELR